MSGHGRRIAALSAIAFLGMLVSYSFTSRTEVIMVATTDSLKPRVFSAVTSNSTPTVSTSNTTVTSKTKPTSNVTYIKDKVLAKLKPSDIIQIYKDSIEPENFNFEVNAQKLRLENKTSGILDQDRCAVVGNAGILHDSACGKDIDSHDYVIRMNLATFDGNFKRDVGTKANITTMNYSQLTRLARCAKKHGLVTSRTCSGRVKPLQLYNHSVIWYPKGGSRKGNMNVLAREMKNVFRFEARWAYSPVSLFGAIPKIWKIRVPSTGLLVLSAAALFCHEITMYGFYPFYTDSHNRTLMYHYYDSAPMNYEKNAHNMPAEFKLFLELEKMGVIRIQQDYCKQ